MAESSAQDRTEQATPKRREDAKKKGQAPRSRELNVLVSLLAGGFAFMVMGGSTIDSLKTMIVDQITFGHFEAMHEEVIIISLSKVLQTVMTALIPLLAMLFVFTLVSPLALGGFVFSANQLLPKFERIDPLKGLKRIFSAKGLMELVKSICKFILVGGTVYFTISSVFTDITLLSSLSINQALSEAGSLFLKCFFGFSSVLIIVAAIDVPFQLWDHSKQLRMTKQEIKDEMKEMDGRPEVKSIIKEKQQQYAQQRMMSEVPNADVVITNPTHYAVALKYDLDGNQAPVVLAKGKDQIAARIREIATEHKVAIFSAPPLARALYSSTDLNEQIPEKLFVAVAQVLAYIFQLQQYSRGSQNKPVPPKNLPVPEEFEIKGNK